MRPSRRGIKQIRKTPEQIEDAVRRIGRRVGKGFTNRQACLLEKENEENLNRWLKTPFYREIFDLEQAEFIEKAFEIMLAGESKEGPRGRAMAYQWLLERRHAMQFGRRNADLNMSVTNNYTVSPEMRADISARAKNLFVTDSKPTEPQHQN